MLYNARFAFRQHPRLEGTHAFLSASQPYWLRYTEDKLIERLTSAQAAAKGTRLHETAARCISDGIELREDGRYPILALYVNHAIEFGMTPEQMLFYSANAYGTADAISFDEMEGFLRIHDLKTGLSKVTMDQLYVYAAFFCLEYGYKPFQIHGELRVYQGDTITEEILNRSYLSEIYDTILMANAVIEEHTNGGVI
ncbi:RecB-like exonuclease/helicase [Streptomyces phage CricKo]|nr:exonuclease/helicase [Streptomyces phage Rainydai]QJD49975.1 RecB-like exonuclease/helicase [Streptomyces phage CricKo]QNL30707.1 RecB-like exonuclease/helicase [Streptomyces phage Thiqqums]